MKEFQSTRPARGATARRIASISSGVFQSTRPVRGATRMSRTPGNRKMIFQSTRPARGATLLAWVGFLLIQNFNPRAPRGARRYRSLRYRFCFYYFNPRAPRGARLICIHFLFSRCLFQSTRPARGATNFSLPLSFKFLFQSTRPARGATLYGLLFAKLLSSFQSTRPARGATALPFRAYALVMNISIHAPREGRDMAAGLNPVLSAIFQSTRPARGATR